MIYAVANRLLKVDAPARSSMQERMLNLAG